ncbi:isocitrate lyase/PEP mutase family protein [Pseudorhodoplanes sp.]|uniref:isocitrate lyase/PEP mutase family protein n=1 Tax=Pseudorhodoplanes sp. TaxID=1934341 RepID=UPI002BC70BEB|nr:isocitrate lyase/PEP mutase family protein [Pseudorhodoplanes sp.]HWV53043.1 isocitrate lyase/PEP mutase family protein [Pseudorhodoplanes sp.]
MTASSAARKKLAARLKEPGLISAPGVFDMISARIADGMGFDALYMTGYGTVASHLGLPDAGLASYTEMVGRVRQIAEGTTTPLIADGDTGYGGLLNVDFTVRGYEAAGAAAIQIEDQEYPKKCGHTPGRRVIPIEDAARRIKVASEARSSKEFLIIARTDSRTALGLDEALRRAEAFLKAGADILFIESPESEAEMEKIGRSFDVPLLANMVEGGRTPILRRAELERLGFKIAIFPASGFLAMGAALRSVYGEILSTGSSKAWPGELYPFNDFSRLMGFERVWAFERDHAEL